MRRREFVRLVAIQAVAWSLGCGRRSSDLESSLPPNPHSGRWMGDDFTAGHRLRDGLLTVVATGAARPDADIVIVGGGISGLTTAWRLSRPGRRVLVLEQASEPGGNARAASWGDLPYAIGAAYFVEPDAGDEFETFYTEIGVLQRARLVPKGEVFVGGQLRSGFWKGDAVPEERAGIVRVANAWSALWNDRYPDIPRGAESGWSDEEFRAMDRRTFASYLDELRAPPSVRRFATHYCWSSFGASPDEISAYAALNFVTAEFGRIRALPGGNGGVTAALTRGLAERGVEIATGEFVAAVENRPRGVEVTAVSGDAVTRVRARACVFAAPRFIAKHVIRALPAERVEIIAGMKWRAYLVANVLLSRRPAHDWYDAYRLDPLAAEDYGWTDLILADFAGAPADRPFAVLTAYRALPYDHGRPDLEDGEDYARHRAAVLRDLEPCLPALGLRSRDVVDVNLARWGHPMVQALPGQLASGGLERVSAPLGRITFAHQDRFGTPAIESAIEAAFRAAAETEALLRG